MMNYSHNATPIILTVKIVAVAKCLQRVMKQFTYHKAFIPASCRIFSYDKSIIAVCGPSFAKRADQPLKRPGSPSELQILYAQSNPFRYKAVDTSLCIIKRVLTVSTGAVTVVPMTPAATLALH